MNFEGFELNENQAKVLSILIKKRDNDEYWRRPCRGWMKSLSIKEEGNFEKRGTVVGCLQAFRAKDIVECQSICLPDGQTEKFFRVSDRFYNSLRFTFHENF